MEDFDSINFSVCVSVSVSVCLCVCVSVCLSFTPLTSLLTVHLTIWDHPSPHYIMLYIHSSSHWGVSLPSHLPSLSSGSTPPKPWFTAEGSYGRYSISIWIGLPCRTHAFPP